jgi:hypothetical protein
MEIGSQLELEEDLNDPLAIAFTTIESKQKILTMKLTPETW